MERATAVAQEQYKSVLTGLQVVGQVKGWKVQQIMFVGGTCGSIHVESFNRNMEVFDPEKCVNVVSVVFVLSQVS